MTSLYREACTAEQGSKMRIVSSTDREARRAGVIKKIFSLFDRYRPKRGNPTDRAPKGFIPIERYAPKEISALSRYTPKRFSSLRSSFIFSGFAMCPFMPAFNDFSLSSSKALAENANIFSLSPPGSFRMMDVAS